MKERVRPWSPKRGEKFEVATAGNVTVKLYRRRRPTIKGKERWVYEVADRTVAGRRMLGFSDLEKARAKAKKIADQLSSGDAAAAAMTNGQAESWGRSVELIRPTGASLEVAADVYAKAYELVGDRILEACNFFKAHGANEVKPRTVLEVVTDCVAHRQGQGKSDRYVNDLRARLKRFAKSFAVDIGSVTTADVQGWLDKLKLSPRSVKNFQGALSTLFSFAESRGYIFKGGNPVQGTERISTNGGGAIEIYTSEEVTKLLRAAAKPFLPVVALGAFAGLRSAEIDRLEWKDLAGGFIHVAAHKAKTRSRRLVPILPNLAQWLAPYSRAKGKVWKDNERALLDARAETVKAAGVEWKDNALRHSWISYRLAEIQDAAKVALEAGNSPAMIFKHYRELVRPEAAAQWFAIQPEVKR
jgi:integrase